MAEKTFQNLAKLKEVQNTVKETLADNYTATIQPFVDIISQVMVANNLNEFESLKKIKEELSIYKSSNAPLFFSAALIEIVESKHFSELKKNEILYN